MPVALTVDVGWPWWVITAIACGVVAAGVSALVVSRNPVARAVAGLLAIEAAVIAVVAPFVMPDMGPNRSAMTAGGGAMGGGSKATEGMSSTTSKRMPFTFFFTRYEFLGDQDNPTGVVYHSDGNPLAGAADGTTITLTGQGGWDPYSRRAAGGGAYTIANSQKNVTARGKWRATAFVSFRQLSGFWGRPLREEGWQGPIGSPTFSGFLKLRVSLDRLGTGTLTAWCAMPAAQEAADRSWDGITLVGTHLRFENYQPNVGRVEGGVMFYGPGSS